MTRPSVDAVPLFARGDHRPSDSCACRPIAAEDLCEPRTVVRIHRRMPDPSDAPPPDADALLWKSREAMGRGGAERGMLPNVAAYPSDSFRTYQAGPRRGRGLTDP